jgi:hypothetical protein
MNTKFLSIAAHLSGEPEIGPFSGVTVDTFGGRIHLEWDPQAAVTPLGQLPFFIEFLKTAELFEPWVEDCPLAYKSPNAPTKTDVLGTMLLSTLAGQNRYAHITALRADGVNPELLGMHKVCSEDSVRRAFEKVDPEASRQWLQQHLRRIWEPLLYEPWILDVDATVKTLYGRQQEGACCGYNPRKPGRPSHVYHTYFVANLRLVLDVEMQPGNQTASKYTRPSLFEFLDSLPKEARPFLLRGDSGFGNENIMKEAEERDQGYLFKLKQTSGVKKLIKRLFRGEEWMDAGQGWQGVESELQLMGWSRKRRVVVLRRPLRGEVVLDDGDQDPQLRLAFIEFDVPGKKYEYAVLVTSLEDDVFAVAQHYRDRADAENNFDELKNQWGWGGYTTKDMARCQVMARIVALVYNWWTLFTRLAVPGKHAEAITSRPLLLHAVGKQTKHAGQTRLTITSSHAKSQAISKILSGLTKFFRHIRESAEQLTWADRWRLILSKVFVHFLGGRPLKPPPVTRLIPPNCRI